jgi:hypothetical protein
MLSRAFGAEFTFKVREDFMQDAAAVFMYAPGSRPGEVHVVQPAELVVKSETMVVPLPVFSLTAGEARRLYEALGQYLGVIDAAHAEAVIKAKDEHLRDLRELVMRQVAGQVAGQAAGQAAASYGVPKESLEAIPSSTADTATISLFFDGTELSRRIADWLTNTQARPATE